MNQARLLIPLFCVSLFCEFVRQPDQAPITRSARKPSRVWWGMRIPRPMPSFPPSNPSAVCRSKTCPISRTSPVSSDSSPPGSGWGWLARFAGSGFGNGQDFGGYGRGRTHRRRGSILGTNPLVADSDGDGYSDFAEASRPAPTRSSQAAT